MLRYDAMDGPGMTAQNDYPPPRRTGPRDALAAYQVAAWRAPGTTRFDSRPANDFLARADAIAPRTLSVVPPKPRPVSRWIIVAIGAGVAALLGALLGGSLSL
jgi:hypothetical protein